MAGAPDDPETRWRQLARFRHAIIGELDAEVLPRGERSGRPPIRRMPWPLSSRASDPTNRSLTTSSLIPFFSSRGLAAGLPCMTPPSRRIRKNPEDFP